MKTFKVMLSRLAASTALVWLTVAQAPAQTFTTLYNFAFSDDYTGGPETSSRLILVSNKFYGSVSTFGWLTGQGNVFAMNMDGSGYEVLHLFGGYVATEYITTDGDPEGGLAISGNTLYGTASGDSVFKMNLDGTGYTNLHRFSETFGSPEWAASNLDGAMPQGGVVLWSNILYGTTYGGGTSAYGVVFAVNTDGTGFTNLHNFTGGDGAYVPCGLVMSGNALYGVTEYGGTANVGTVFRINTDGTGFTNLHSFIYSDGAYPFASLTTDGSTLYGTAGVGGGPNLGTIFKLNIDGTGFSVLHVFTNSDGVQPRAPLILSGSTLYGTAPSGDAFNSGTVFAVNKDGTGFTVLHNFTPLVQISLHLILNADGVSPINGLTLSGNTLYGTTSAGGSYNSGTLFSISMLPMLTITPASGTLILSWPTNIAGFDYSGYTLQCTTNLASPVWTTNLPTPVVVNGQYTVTNPVSGTQQFLRLSQ